MNALEKNAAARILPAHKAAEACRLPTDLEQAEDVTEAIRALCL